MMCHVRIQMLQMLIVSFKICIINFRKIKLIIYFIFIVTSHLCSTVISQLMQTASSVMQLHERLRTTEDSNGTRNNNIMFQELEKAVIMTQNMFTKITNK